MDSRQQITNKEQEIRNNKQQRTKNKALTGINK